MHILLQMEDSNHDGLFTAVDICQIPLYGDATGKTGKSQKNIFL
jgi:hypothetical protein